MLDFLFRKPKKHFPESRQEIFRPSEMTERSFEKPFKSFGRIAEAVKSTVDEMNREVDDEAELKIREQLALIEVIAFVGPSGTGKSTRAIQVAHQQGVDYLIDDGILIHETTLVAGNSAKRAATKIDSIRQAIFADETRASTMRRSLYDESPQRLMILGTSDDMIQRICSNLWLNPPQITIRIEDITTPEERRRAKETRMSEGKHTIPVPSMEIRHDFSGSLTEPLLKWKRKLDRSGREGENGENERTVVRPTFSALGHYSISDDAMTQMVELIVTHVPGVSGMCACFIRNESYGANFKVELALVYGYDAQQTLKEAQVAISEKVEKLTSINVLTVDVRAQRVVH